MNAARARARAWVVALLLLSCGLARAARLPDWAAAVAGNAPALPEGVSKVSSRILLSETRLTLEADGKLRTRRRLATQAVRAQADEIGIGAFHFKQGANVKLARAWHVPPSGKAEKSGGPPVDVTLDSAFLTDQRSRFVAVAGIRKGSLVFFEFEAVEVPEALAVQHVFFEAAPVDLARFEIETPLGWSVRHAWLRAAGGEPVVSGNLSVWELRDIPAPEEIPLGDAAIDRAPLLLVNVLPPEGAKITPAVLPDWVALATWYEALARDREAVTPEIVEASRRALAGAGPDFFARLQAVGRYVRDGVRYVAKEVGIGGYIPRPATQVVRELYGDCKDKGTLFRALLAVDGLTSYPILIHATQDHTVSNEIPSLGSFNHFVVGVVVPAGAGVPPSFVNAVNEAGELGSLLVVDTTDDRTSIGSLPAALAGKRGLVLAGSRTRIVELAGTDASAHRIEHRLETELLAGGKVAGRMRVQLLGEPAAAARSAHRESARARQEERERQLDRLWSGASFEDYGVELETGEGTFVETSSFNAVMARQSGSGRLFSLFPGALDDLPRVKLVKRGQAVIYAHAQTLRFESVIKGFPADTALPIPFAAEGSGWSATSRAERAGDEIRATWEVVLSRPLFEPAEFDELKRFWTAADRAAAGALLLPDP